MSEVDPAIMKLGQEPPLAGSEWVTGPVDNLVRIQFRGLTGPIKVKGEEWNLVMPPNAATLQTDEKIAAVLTYVRNSWGNGASVVTTEDVAPYRKEIGQPMLTVADLSDPTEAQTETPKAVKKTKGKKRDETSKKPAAKKKAEMKTKKPLASLLAE